MKSINKKENKLPVLRNKPKYSLNDILKIMDLYSQVVYCAGVIDAYGSEIDAPSSGASDKLTALVDEVYKEIPQEIIESEAFQKYLPTIEDAIGYCKETHSKLNRT